MAIGEKLWEGKAKSTMMAIKGADAGGVTIEATWMAQLMGMGKAKGWDGSIIFTGKTMMAPSGVGESMGTGMLNFMSGDMAVVKGSGVGKVEMGKSKSVGVWSFMSMSPKLAWMNTAVALVTLEGDPSWMEFDVAIWEWK
ncbi:MAG: hypothetical protein ABSF44_04210 [Candidatus Bathyarchaeia archaeon]|jgi:hypothetical protein